MGRPPMHKGGNRVPHQGFKAACSPYVLLLRARFFEPPLGPLITHAFRFKVSLSLPLALTTSYRTHLDTPDSLFCAGHTLLADGRVVIVGGHVANAGWPAGIQNIRSYSYGDPGLITETKMRYPRWYATATLLPNQMVLIMGGTQGVGAGTANNPYYEIWDPSEPGITMQFKVEPTYLTYVKQNFFPFNYVLPTGDVFNYCARVGWIMDPMTGTYKVRV